MALRISNNGNLIETFTMALGTRGHRVILDTSGVGDRRQRKAVARAKMAEMSPPGFQVPSYADVRMHMTGIIRSVNIRFTLTV